MNAGWREWRGIFACCKLLEGGEIMYVCHRLYVVRVNLCMRAQVALYFILMLFLYSF